MFKVGDKVIHNSYGLCEIAAIETQNTYYGKQECYIIYMQGTKVMIPIAHAEALRCPIKKEEIPKFFEVFSDYVEIREKIPSQERIKIYTAKFKTNETLKLAEVLRDLTFFDEIGKLKGPEKNLLEHIKKILVEEISFARGISNTEGQRLIEPYLKMIRERAKGRR
jgi:RNA polymerase-interacting CarD/CdnL/TRCF family regulator